MMFEESAATLERAVKMFPDRVDAIVLNRLCGFAFPKVGYQYSHEKKLY